MKLVIFYHRHYQKLTIWNENAVYIGVINFRYSRSIEINKIGLCVMPTINAVNKNAFDKRYRKIFDNGPNTK